MTRPQATNPAVGEIQRMALAWPVSTRGQGVSLQVGGSRVRVLAKGTHPGCRFNPWPRPGVCGRPPVGVLSHIDVSLSSPPSSPPPPQISGKSPRSWGEAQNNTHSAVGAESLFLVLKPGVAAKHRCPYWAKWRQRVGHLQRRASEGLPPGPEAAVRGDPHAGRAHGCGVGRCASQFRASERALLSSSHMGTLGYSASRDAVT